MQRLHSLHIPENIRIPVAFFQRVDSRDFFRYLLFCCHARIVFLFPGRGMDAYLFRINRHIRIRPGPLLRPCGSICRSAPADAGRFRPVLRAGRFGILGKRKIRHDSGYLSVHTQDLPGVPARLLFFPFLRFFCPALFRLLTPLSRPFPAGHCVLPGGFIYSPASRFHTAHKGFFRHDHKTDDGKHDHQKDRADHPKEMLQDPCEGTGKDAPSHLRIRACRIERRDRIAFHGRGLPADQLQRHTDQKEKKDPCRYLQGREKIPPVGYPEGKAHKNKHGNHIGHHAENPEHHAAHRVSHRADHAEIT